MKTSTRAISSTILILAVSFAVASFAEKVAAQGTSASSGLSNSLSSREMVDYINPMIGASTSKEFGEGKTFPGAATPFGMVQLSPDTITGGDNGPGYSCHHKTIEGFSFTHMSGVGWYGDLGNFQVMPTTGMLQVDREQAKSPFSHEEETAKAGYYSVMLKRYNILTELTAAPRAGIIRFTFPEAESSRIQIDLARRIGQKQRWLSHGKQYIKVVDDHTIEGWMNCPHEDGGWGHGSGRVSYTQYFHAEFSKPIKKFGVWDKEKIMPGLREYEGQNTGFYLEFATKKGEQVLLKTGVSYVSQKGATANLKHDIPDWEFDVIRKKARSLWADALNCIDIEGGTESQKEIFATALYHSFIDPRSVSDVDGGYIGADNNEHKAEGFVYRSIFSGWDVFRSHFPLLTIIRPDVINDEVNSLVQMAELSGNEYYPRWELLNSYSGCMIGDPAVCVVAEAYKKGIRDYDVKRAYQYALNSVDRTTNMVGFTPDSVSWTLENAYFDYCAALLAEEMKDSDRASSLHGRAQFYRNIYDPSVGNMRAKSAPDKWTQWRGATTEGQGCVESNPYQQGWFVPHDVQGLINLMGREYYLSYLTEFFEKTPLSFKWNDYYNHANEPVHHVPYMFPYARAPWLTQKWVRTIMDHAYGTGIKGLCGNDDVGQMSAWFLLSSIGFHPVDPASGIYVIGSPLFDKVTVRLDPKYYTGGSFKVIARNNSRGNIYIQSAKLHGEVLDRSWITHEDIVKGGTLEFIMGPEPNKDWASSKESVPPSISGDAD